MPESKKQTKANRGNAKKSTGPKSDEGKKAASKNAVKHGLYSRDIVISSPALSEDRAEYDLLLDSLCEELAPETIFQEFLVTKIANCLWRCRRAVAAETAHINHRLDNVEGMVDIEARFNKWRDHDNNYPDVIPPENEEEKRYRTRLIGMRMIPTVNDSFNILRYEMRLDRQMMRSYRLLLYLKLGQGAKSLQEPYNESKK